MLYYVYVSFQCCEFELALSLPLAVKGKQAKATKTKKRILESDVRFRYCTAACRRAAQL